MQKETFVVAYEGDESDSSLLDFAIARAKKNDARIVLAHILEWSPYKFLTPEELEERHKRRGEELNRAETDIVAPALDKIRSAGVEADAVLKHGNVIDLLVSISAEAGASMVFCGRSGSNSVAARLFGSVPMGLAQISVVPIVIVP